MVVEWLDQDIALDVLAVFPLYSHFDCLFCSIIYRQISGVWGDLKSPHTILILNNKNAYCLLTDSKTIIGQSKNAYFF